jgi:copper chaperone NosL
MRKIAFTLLMMCVACGPGPDQPAEPVWGKQACEHCMMLVSDPRPAAQAVLVGGTRMFFDDVGCLVEWLDDSGHVPMGVWVRAPDGQGWTDAYSARYSDGHRTPMDHGYLSSTRGSSFEQLRAAVHERRRLRLGER